MMKCRFVVSPVDYQAECQKSQRAPL